MGTTLSSNASTPLQNPFQRLPPEVLEHILLSTLDRAPVINLTQLLLLQKVSLDFVTPARRLIFRNLYLRAPLAGRKLGECLISQPELGQLARTLIIHPRAYTDPSIFDALTFQRIVEACPLLLSIDNSAANMNTVDSVTSVTYPASLQSFRFSPLKVYEPDSDDEEEEGDDSDDEQDDDLAFPSQLWQLRDLPVSLSELSIENAGLHKWPFGLVPESLFPLPRLTSFAFSLSDGINGDFIEWMLAPSVQNRTIKRLKFWNLSNLSGTEVASIVESVGSELEEFYYKLSQGQSRDQIPGMLRHCTKLRRLTLGPHALSPGIYAALPTTSLTHLCLSLGNNVTLIELQTALTLKLSNVRRLELYSGIYFPPPVEVDFIDDEDMKTGSQLRELRLSHVSARDGHFESFFDDVGSNLRILSMHHVALPFVDAVEACPRLLRLELGVVDYYGLLFDVSDSDAWLGRLDLKRLHLLRVHLKAMIGIEELVKIVKEKKFTDLKTLDVCGKIPDELPTDWTGKMFDQLYNATRENQVHFALNGRTVATLGDLLSAVTDSNGSVRG